MPKATQHGKGWDSSRVESGELRSVVPMSTPFKAVIGANVHKSFFRQEKQLSLEAELLLLTMAMIW